MYVLSQVNIYCLEYHFGMYPAEEVAEKKYHRIHTIPKIFACKDILVNTM